MHNHLPCVPCGAADICTQVVAAHLEICSGTPLCLALPGCIQEASPSGAPHKLPACGGEVVTAQGLHIQRHLAHRLGSIQQVGNAFPLCYGPHCCCIGVHPACMK